MTEAVAINRELRMQFFVDQYGEETDDAFEAVTAIAPLPDGDWIVLDLTEFDPVAYH